jgi:dihydrofolate reductase
MISIIVAVSEDWGIGKDNDLLWHLPDDLKRFKKLTSGNTILMGKKTWESLPRRPLPNRINIVLTDNREDKFEGAVTAFSIDDAISKCNKEDEIFIIGGGSIYRQFMTIADKLYITHVHSKTAADIYFPEIDPAVWKVSESEECTDPEKYPVPYTYKIYLRKK